MTIEEAIVGHLIATPDVTALIGSGVSARIYPEQSPQNADFPHITYQVIDYPQMYHLAGPSGIAHPRIQVDCWTRGPTGKKQAVELAEAVRRATGGNPQNRKLDGFAGMMGDVRVQRCELVNRSYTSEPPVHADEPPFRRASLDFVVHFDEAA